MREGARGGRRHAAGRFRPGLRAAAALGAALAATTLLAPAGGADHAADRGHLPAAPVPPLAHDGRWFTDATGRTVLLHGVNFVRKSPPYHVAGAGFGVDDVDFLAERGFNVFRLGVVFGALMPEPGVIDESYLDALAVTVRDLARRRIFVLLDFHQDGYGPVTGGNGFPAWATVTDGLPNPPVGFPLYYVLNPALQRAFQNFWANVPAPDGVGIQDHYLAAARALARRFAHEPYVLGYEAMNEPWPGHDWTACLTGGCPDLERDLLVPFYERFAAAVRSVDRRHLVFVEPFVLFNFGMADTALPAIGAPAHALSIHMYALTPQDDLAVLDHGIAAAERTGDALLATEWGATSDAAAIEQRAAQFDDRLVPWVFWAYDENVVRDTRLPPADANLRLPTATALTRPYPVATAGTPRRLAFDPATGVLDYEFTPARPAGPPTAIAMPRATYPDGYTATVTGGRVVSRPCAATLAVVARTGAANVAVHAAPGGACG